MTRMKLFFFIFFIFFGTIFSDSGQEKISSLYRSLDPLSVTQNLAFYELYPDSVEGKSALRQAWKLLASDTQVDCPECSIPKIDIAPLLSLLIKPSSDPPVTLPTEQKQAIENLASSLANRKLPGSKILTEKELLQLPSEEIDLGRGLLVCLYENDPDFLTKLSDYETSLDLMALQIRAVLPEGASGEEKIAAINRFLFQESGFRYPPKSLDAKHIDLYTFLPSVLDGRRGVCLGVSILYLCLAQRLDLPLEIITPPGHIYLRYRGQDGYRNIETTARGIRLPCETYLGVNTRSLQKRTLKEVIGLTFFNQASMGFATQDYERVISLYEKTLQYSPDDPFFSYYLGIHYLFAGKTKQARPLLLKARRLTLEHAVSQETLAEDYLNGYTDVAMMKTIFLPVDENRSSVSEKEHRLKKALKKYPKFRAGLFQLATCYLQLRNTREALNTLLQYHTVDPRDVTVEYYLAILSAERYDYIAAKKFLQNALSLAKERGHAPKALLDLSDRLNRLLPDSEP